LPFSQTRYEYDYFLNRNVLVHFFVIPMKSRLLLSFISIVALASSSRAQTSDELKPLNVGIQLGTNLSTFGSAIGEFGANNYEKFIRIVRQLAFTQGIF